MVPEKYKEVLEIIKSHGFNLIAISTMIAEHTFYFSTEDEAQKAYEYFELGHNPENKKLCDGWWYSVEDLEKNKETYLLSFKTHPPEVYFLND